MRPAANRKRYLAVPPTPPLRPFVECLWAHWIPDLGVLVAGPQSRHTSRPIAAPMLAIGARFHPGVAEVAAQVYVSERQLQRRFADRIGYGPKTFQRIARFQRAARQLRRGGVELARAAAAAGYADQAHLTRESRRLAGLSPRQLVSWMG